MPKNNHSPDIPIPLPVPFQRQAAAVEILLLDVDGVLTDGAIIYNDAGQEIKNFYVRDGAAIKYWQMAGKQVAIISARTSRTVDVRAAELGIELVRQGALDKRPAMEEILQSQGLGPRQACYIGDDLPDMPAMRAAGLAVAVADAVAEVRRIAHYVTRAAGGRGAVREVIELLLQSQGQWDALLARYS